MSIEACLLQCVAVCCSAFSNGSRHSHMSIGVYIYILL